MWFQFVVQHFKFVETVDKLDTSVSEIYIWTTENCNAPP